MNAYSSWNLHDAIDLVNKAIELNPNNDALYAHKWNILEDIWDKELAYSFYMKAIGLNKSNIDAYGGLGDIAKWNQKYTEAISYYQSALDINPNNSFYILQKWISIMKLGETQREKVAFEVAIDEFDKCIRLNPNSWEAYFFKGIALMWLKQEFKASEMFDKVLLIDPNNLDAKKMKEIADKKVSEIFKPLQ